MAKRNTETLFLRVDPEVARLVRRASDERQVGISQLAETALRQHLAETTGAEDRKNLLSAVEEALVARVDERVNSALRRVGDLYAKEAFDHAEGLFLIKALLSVQLDDERAVERYLVSARKDATERLRHRAGPIADALAEAREYAEQFYEEREEARAAALRNKRRYEKAESALKQAEKQISELVERVQTLQGNLDELRQMNEFERTRDEWAAKQYEGQGILRRKSFNEWRDEFTRQHYRGIS